MMDEYLDTYVRSILENQKVTNGIFIPSRILGWIQKLL